MTEKKVAASRRNGKRAHGPSPYERAAEIAPTHPNTRLLRRMQDSNFREVRRLTNLLLKLKRYELRMEALEKGRRLSRSSQLSASRRAGLSHDNVHLVVVTD